MGLLAVCAFGLAGVGVGLCVVRKAIQWRWRDCVEERRMDRKIVIITGANSGIGKEVALDLAKRGAILLLACRDPSRADEAINHIKIHAPDAQIHFVKLDLNSLESVKKCAEDILTNYPPQIDLLINNAGVALPKEETHQTADGFEQHYGVNHLGHFLLTHKLLNRIKSTPHSRIVIVSSMLYKDGSLYPLKKKSLYANSKLANILHGRKLKTELKGHAVGVHCVSPGFVRTNLFRYTKQTSSVLKRVGFLLVSLVMMRTAKQGAQTILHCSLSDEVDTEECRMYRDCHAVDLLPNALDLAAADKLWQQSLQQVAPFL